MNYTIGRGELDGVLVFLAVAEARGFRAAARRLGITPSAVSQAIRTFEQRVGVPLLARTTRSVGLTEAGARLLLQVRPAAQQVLLGIESARNFGEVCNRAASNQCSQAKCSYADRNASCLGSLARTREYSLNLSVMITWWTSLMKVAMPEYDRVHMYTLIWLRYL